MSSRHSYHDFWSRLCWTHLILLQDPRGAAFPSAPPVASGATAPAGQSGVPITHGSLPQGTQPANLRPEESSSDLDPAKVKTVACPLLRALPLGLPSTNTHCLSYLELSCGDRNKSSTDLISVMPPPGAALNKQREKSRWTRWTSPALPKQPTQM